MKLSAGLFLVLAMLLFRVVSPTASGQEISKQGKSFYAIAAEPAQEDSSQTYPAALYVVDGSNRQLDLVRQLFTEKDDFKDVTTDLNGNYYLAASNGLQIVHAASPGTKDFVPLSSYDDFRCSGVVAPPKKGAFFQYCHGDRFAVIAIKSTGNSTQKQQERGSWRNFKYLRYQGMNGGPFQGMPPYTSVGNGYLGMPFSFRPFRPKVVIAKLPDDLTTAVSNAAIMGMNANYLAVWVPPPYLRNGSSVSTLALHHADSIKVRVLDRKKDVWRTVDTSTTVTDISNPVIRLFGDWLTAEVTQWSESGEAGPGRNNERTVPDDGSTPDIRGQYEDTYINLYLPGTILLKNLSDNRDLTLHTGQEDTEVLAIRDGHELIYRVNDAIFSAQIVGSRIGKGTLICKGDTVPDVHWVFWGAEQLPTESR